MKNEKSFRISRRPFLAGLGATGAGMFLRPLIAEAQGVVPQRLLIIHRPCGGVPAQWFPTTTGPSYTLPPLLQPFGPVRNNMLVVKGIKCPRTNSNPGDKHGQGLIGMMTGVDAYHPPGTPEKELTAPDGKFISSPVATIDQDALSKIPALKGPTIPSIQLAGSRTSMQGSGSGCLRVISYSGPNLLMWPEGRSDIAFNNILGSVVVGPGDPAAAARLQAQNKSVLDFVSRDLTRLKTLIPASQIPKLDAHTQAIRELELKITTTPPPTTGGCSKPMLAMQPKGSGSISNDEAEHGTLIKNMFSVIKSAFQCDTTRVATITFAHGNSSLAPKDFIPGAAFNATEGHHTVSHNGNGADVVAAKAAAEKFYGEIVAAAMLDMQNTPEGSGTLLDNTLVVYWNECSIGDDHNINDIPVLLLGGKFLKLNAGNYIQLSPAVYMNDIWAAMLTAWGVPTTVYGATKFGKGPAPNVFL
jgi:hypothetical protein